MLLFSFIERPNKKKIEKKSNKTYCWFLYMTRNICDIHSHSRYLRAIKLACRRCHVGQHFSIVFTQFDLFLCYLAQCMLYFFLLFQTNVLHTNNIRTKGGIIQKRSEWFFYFISLFVFFLLF